MGKIKIAVLFGGRSPEHSISCISANSILSVLDRNKYEVTPIGITMKNEWVVFKDKSPFLDLVKADLPEVKAEGISQNKSLSSGLITPPELLTTDVVFPILHGPNGEDGTIQGLFELLNLKYVGSGVLSSSVCMDKTVTKALLSQGNLPIGDYLTISNHDWLANKSRITSAIEKMSFPLFIKPARSGSSLGISKVKDFSGVEAAIEKAREFDKKVIVEASIENSREIECGVLGGYKNFSVRASLPAEIIVKSEHEFYDFEAKYIDDSVDLVVPANLSEALLTQVQDLSIKVFELLNCAGLARIDFFITKNNEVIINEVNTMPGFTSISMFPRMWKSSGVNYADLVDYLVEEALNRVVETN
jgi:D-alanine-D-alanine ligase